MRSKLVVRARGFLDLKDTQLGVVADALRARLVARRVSFSTAETTLRVASHFARWVARRRGAPLDVTRDTLRNFWTRHLPRCRCAGRPRCGATAVRAALGNLAHVLLAEGRLGGSLGSTDAIGHELRSFEAHLATVCGCVLGTIRQWSRMVGEFLREVFPEGRLDRGAISQENVVRFVTSRAPRLRPGSVGVLATALRSYFRFLQLRGVPHVGRLIHAVPTIARWRLDSVPAHLSEEELRRVWASFRRTTPRGRRDYAMTLLMSVLGLRAQEVASLNLEDFDWRSGLLRVPPTKTRRGRELPLPAMVGTAVAAYFRSGRPASSSRRAFLRIGVSEGEPVDASAVRVGLRAAYRRADMPRHYTGTHRLRHTAATRLIRGGAGVKEVADLLGHRSLDSTAVYAKVDLPRLRAVAMPWPRRSR